VQAAKLSRSNINPGVSGGIDSESFVKPVQLLAIMATDPLIVQLRHGAHSKASTVNISGVRGTLDTAVITHAVNTALTFASAFSTWPSRPPGPAPALAIPTSGDAWGAGAQLKSPHVVSITIELAVIDVGDKSATFDIRSKHQPRVCRLLLFGGSVKHESNPEDGLQVVARDFLLLDLRALLPKFRAIVEQRERSSVAGTSPPALNLQKYLSGAHLQAFSIIFGMCFHESCIWVQQSYRSLGKY
jgi:hypothetical protein